MICTLSNSGYGQLPPAWSNALAMYLVHASERRLVINSIIRSPRYSSPCENGKKNKSPTNQVCPCVPPSPHLPLHVESTGAAAPLRCGCLATVSLRTKTEGRKHHVTWRLFRNLMEDTKKEGRGPLSETSVPSPRSPAWVTRAATPHL
jgi:hypothetical protein